MDYSPYAQKLESLRMHAGLTQQEVGAALGYGQARISLYERGERRPNPAKFARIVRYLEAIIAGDEARAQAIRDEAA